ncbi:MAG: BatA domain-containing protein [Planctomycetes bacterium]|nr:BatA domain-containing protein [Planctomycetota bacterium]
MSFATPLGLWALLALPAVVALHLFRRRLPERRVAALFLFAGEQLAADAGRTRTRLLRTPSLWLEGLAALLLALWLAAPTFGEGAPRHLVVVLDDSASMQAGGRDRAAAEVLRQAGALAGRDRVTLLRTGARPQVLDGPVAAAAVAGALARWRPVQPRHDPLPALDLALELAGPGGEVVFCTDAAPPTPLPDVAVHAFGVPAANCSLGTVQRVPRPEGGEDLRVGVVGHGAVAATSVTVRVDGVVWRQQDVPLREGAATVQLPLPPGAREVHVALGADALPLDGEAWLLPPPDRTVAVCDLLPAPLRARLDLARVLAAIGGVRAEADPRRAELLVAAAPGVLRPGQTEVVVAPGAGERRAFAGPFTIDRGHPWLVGVELQGIAWLAGPAALPGQVLVAAGAVALVSEELPEAGRRLWLNFDPAAGNLVRAPDWPVLWANVVERARLEVPGPERSEVRLGDEVRHRRAWLAEATDVVAVEAPDGTRRPLAGGRLTAFVPEQPGVHRLLDAAGGERARVAARCLDPAESDLRGLATGTWPRQVAGGAPRSAGGGRDDAGLRQVLLLLLVAVLAADWWWLQRRPA